MRRRKKMKKEREEEDEEEEGGSSRGTVYNFPGEAGYQISLNK